MMRFGVFRGLLGGLVFLATVFLGHRFGVHLVFLVPSACTLTSLVLIAKSADFASIIRSFLLCVVGMLIGTLFAPATSPPGEPGDVFVCMAVGALLTWVIGVVIAHRDVLAPIEDPNMGVYRSVADDTSGDGDKAEQ